MYRAGQDELSDDSMAKLAKMSKRTYERAKAELVLSGVIEIRRLNASYIILMLGSDAIDEDIETYRGKAGIKMSNYVLAYMDLEPVTLEELAEYVKSEPRAAYEVNPFPFKEVEDSFQHNKEVLLSLDLVQRGLDDMWNPMPTEKDII